MTRLIKLTDKDGYTRRGYYNETLWLPLGTKPPPKLDGVDPCYEELYHAYTSPEQAVILDLAHTFVFYDGGRAWWAEGEIIVQDRTKVGCRELWLVEPIELPRPKFTQRVRAAIYCTRAVLPSGVLPTWWDWALAWCSGLDRFHRGALETRRAMALESRSMDFDKINLRNAFAAAYQAVEAVADATPWAAARSVESALMTEIRFDLPGTVQRAFEDER